MDGREVHEVFKYDVFISYTRQDNEKGLDSLGWVDRFEVGLGMWLRRLSGRKAIKIWRDVRDLDPSVLFDEEIESALGQSAILIALLSPTFVNSSEYCQSELRKFRQKAGEQSIGFKVGNAGRIVPVRLANLAPDTWPQECQRTSGFDFFEEPTEGVFVPVDPASKDFETRLQILAQKLCGLLNKVHTTTRAQATAESAADGIRGNGATSAVPGDPEIASGDDRFKIFLAYPTYGLEHTQRQLAKALKMQGFDVVRDVPPPHAEDAHEEKIVHILRNVHLSVHLMGELPGEPIDDANSDKTYPMEQARLALEHARSQLILFPEETDITHLPSGGYAEFVQTVADMEREENRLAVETSGRHQMIDRVLAKRRSLEAAAKRLENAGAGVGTAFIDIHLRDVTRAAGLLGKLEKRGVQPILITSADSAPIMKPFEDNLVRSNLFIVFFGEANRKWVEGRLQEALKLIVTNHLPFRPAVFLGGDHGEESRFAGVFDVLNGLDDVDRLVKSAERSAK